MPDARIKLLIVDDEPSTRMLLFQVFTELGHDVRTAEDGFSALQEIRKEVPDLVLSDLNMPGMSGFELLSVVRRRFPSIRVIAMSGAFSGDAVQPGVAADAFYEKATNLISLLRIVESLTNPPLLNLQQQGSCSPIWIQKNGHNPEGEEFVIISCPECLRTFPQVLGKIALIIQETTCVHCHSLIHYAIVQPTDPSSPQTFQLKPGAGLPMLRDISNLN